ncbi:hypothetical protein ESCNG_20215 [Neisseria gonorrhoeae]|nr:hypothetical protein ESCNG_20215 [Neisseria gonorrhoeae]SCW15085.1 hypothetical protein ESCNG_30212 [Neisseria gonorrhoeae]
MNVRIPACAGMTAEILFILNQKNLHLNQLAV